MDLMRLRGLTQADALYNRNGSCRLDQSPAARAPRPAQKRSYVVPPSSVVAIVAVMFSPLIHHSPVRCTSLSLSPETHRQDDAKGVPRTTTRVRDRTRRKSAPTRSRRGRKVRLLPAAGAAGEIGSARVAARECETQTGSRSAPGRTRPPVVASVPVVGEWRSHQSGAAGSGRVCRVCSAPTETTSSSSVEHLVVARHADLCSHRELLSSPRASPSDALLAPLGWTPTAERADVSRRRRRRRSDDEDPDPAMHVLLDRTRLFLRPSRLRHCSNPCDISFWQHHLVLDVGTASCGSCHHHHHHHHHRGRGSVRGRDDVRAGRAPQAASKRDRLAKVE